MLATARYVDWRRVGSGAHGVVYRVFDNGLRRDVAVKILNERARQDPALVEGLRREVLISRDLRHPNICPIHDLYDGPEGVGVLMDFINGVDLAEWLKTHADDILATAGSRHALLTLLAEALAVAHTRIVHRDLKPSNIFLVEGDILRPVIMDFGISVIDAESDGGICGTPKYMAPEQYLAPRKVDQRSDLFALGIIAYEVFTAKIPPTSLRHVAKTRAPPRVALEDIEPLSMFCPVVPPALDRLIAQMMAYDQEDRPRSAEEVAATLRQVTLESVDVLAGAGSFLKRERVSIPGGIVHLGSPPTCPNSSEKPARRIQLAPFQIDGFPVTNLDYKTFVRATGCRPTPLGDDPVFGRDDHPVVGLTFDEAQLFAGWAGGKLPSEAQWECAARGGVKFAEYPWGALPPSPLQANIDGAWRSTSPVNAHPSGRNAYGLWDACGNAWEWCVDAFDPAFYGSIANDCMNPVNSRASGPRTVRGGSFESFAGMGRCAFRMGADPSERRRDIGFRLVYDR